MQVSHWTFPSVILSSVTYGYFFGGMALLKKNWCNAITSLPSMLSGNMVRCGAVGAAMWTSTSGVVVVWLFAIMAIELKYKAPTAHTFLEVIKVRWGNWAHGVRSWLQFPHTSAHIATCNAQYCLPAVTLHADRRCSTLWAS